VVAYSCNPTTQKVEVRETEKKGKEGTGDRERERERERERKLTQSFEQELHLQFKKEHFANKTETFYVDFWSVKGKIRMPP
jgi:hypothetical protein